MLFPERGTPEFDAVSERVARHIVDTVSEVAVRRKDLPDQVHALIYDEPTQERFGAFVRVQYTDDCGLANITRTSIGRVAPGVAVITIAGILLRHNPGIPLVCDNKITDELSQGSIPWVEEGHDREDGHYRLEGRAGGILEVYTPYKGDQKEILPSDVTSVQIFTE